MADGCLQRRLRPGGAAEHCRLTNAQRIKKTHVNVCLRLWRSIGWHCSAQVAETRNRDHPGTVLSQSTRKGDALIVPTATPMTHQQRCSAADLLILKTTARRCNQQTLSCGAGARAFYVLIEAPSNREACDYDYDADQNYCH